MMLTLKFFFLLTALNFFYPLSNSSVSFSNDFLESFSKVSPEDEATIRAILDQQANCWNQGDIDCFMESYWQSDSLMFIGGNGVTYGFNNTYQRYQTKYPDRAAMGQLTFNIIKLDQLASNAYHMVGQWTLDRNSGNIGGYFTLLFRKIGGQWLIVSDHTSSSTP